MTIDSPEVSLQKIIWNVYLETLELHVLSFLEINKWSFSYSGLQN